MRLLFSSVAFKRQTLSFAKLFYYSSTVDSSSKSPADSTLTRSKSGALNELPVVPCPSSNPKLEQLRKQQQDGITLKQFILSIGSIQLDFYRAADDKWVVLIPMFHVASQEFYDSVLHELHTRRPVDAVLVEGIFDDKEAYNREIQELATLTKDRALAEKVEARVRQGTHFSEAMVDQQLKAYCIAKEDYVSCNLRVEELYFKALMKCIMPEKIIPSDVIATEVRRTTDIAHQHRLLTTGRNEHVLGILDEALEKHQAVAITWGFSHAQAFSRGLQEMGFQQQGSKAQVIRRSFGWTSDMFDRSMEAVKIRKQTDPSIVSWQYQ